MGFWFLNLKLSYDSVGLEGVANANGGSRGLVERSIRVGGVAKCFTTGTKIVGLNTAAATAVVGRSSRIWQTRACPFMS